MIKSVELGNFISHSETRIPLEAGVTVFVGHNGAGKSSIIDAITFALFGEHTRKSNKGLIRRGTSQAYAKICFSVKGKLYEAVRKIDSKGVLHAQFFEITDGNRLPLAAGERKQFGESMTEQVESRIGLDFTKLKVASIVQQGELNAIIKAKPKEFKELLNIIIGIDKLDLASENFKIVQKNFRDSIRQKYGYDDTYIDVLEKEIQQKQQEVKWAEPKKLELQKRKEVHEKELQGLEQKIKTDSQKESILKQLDERKQELRSYVREAIIEIQKEIAEKERKIAECEGCFESADLCSGLESILKKTELEMNEVDKKISDFEKQQAILNEHRTLAKKLQLQDGKCPVCDTKVKHLKPVFQVEHIRTEMEKITMDLEALRAKKQKSLKEKIEAEAKQKKAFLAKRTLEVHSIHSPAQIQQMRAEIEHKKAQIQKIPTADSSGLLIEAATIDPHSRLLCEKIESLQKEVSGFDPTELGRQREEFEKKQKEISKIDQEYGAITEKIKQSNQRIEKIGSVLFELKHVKEYLALLSEIQNNIYSRDGPAATSLRSWALANISAKASEYLEMLNTKIHRVSLAEKTRDVSITCYSKNTIIDIDSLSGGEQISVSLALRLGMAHLLGASNLNFVILDEPTTHLDGERRKSLVRVLSQLSDISSNAPEPMQLIIITHDSEIFDDSTVEKIYRFEAGPDGTIVSLL
jgi:exonuclease SbcC